MSVLGQLRPSSLRRSGFTGVHVASDAAKPRTLACKSRSQMAVVAAMKPSIMVNSCAGKMGQAVAEAVLRAGLDLVPYTLCKPAEATENQIMTVMDKIVQLVPPGAADKVVSNLKKQYPNLVMVDYTLPDAVNEMASFYVKHGIPFVMGTTGGDREQLFKITDDSKLYCVIAPNMGKQIVAFQAMMQRMADDFGGAFAGYTLRVTESHQSTKKDTSGTAKDVVSSFQKLGLNFDVSEIELVRDPEEQVNRMKVPKHALAGHAFHTYSLISGDGSVVFEYQHNVVGRTTYAEGTVDACLFLARQIEAKAEQTRYNMIDVLQAGAMR